MKLINLCLFYASCMVVPNHKEEGALGSHNQSKARPDLYEMKPQ